MPILFADARMTFFSCDKNVPVPGSTAIITTIDMASPASLAEEKWKITSATYD
jgi:hypothetical protein